jgi:hypothetical protein
MPVCKYCGSSNVSEIGPCVACGKELVSPQDGPTLSPTTLLATDPTSLHPATLTGLASHNDGPQGLGGWLSLFFIGMVILGPLLNLLDALNSHDNFSRIFCLLFAGYEIFVGVLIAKSSARAIMHLRIYFGICILLGILNIAYSAANPMAASQATYAGESVSTTGSRDLIAAIVWALYFRTSKRVFNTFGRNL